MSLPVFCNPMIPWLSLDADVPCTGFKYERIVDSTDNCLFSKS